MNLEHPSWQVKGESILPELIALMGLTVEDQHLLAGLSARAVELAPRLTDTFYARLFAHPNTAEYLQEVSIDRLHTMVAQWFVELFTGRYDADYARKRLNIGQIHVRIGLPVRYPLAMLDVVMPFGEELARESPAPEQTARAFRKLLALDVAIFNQAYEDNQLSHLTELVGGERLARLLLAGEA
ncbi:MAG TPA: protoglobin domain-containing protein [Roseiflexaceae bacterium]|nr:protoglobin domain-containing protein [Roseiflexaceae bacterium]